MDPFVGEVRMVGFNFEPVGWLTCDGRILQVSQYQALFSLLGNIYGGNGTSTFALPDLRGRVPLHLGQGTGLTSRKLGDKGGSRSVVIVPKLADFTPGTQGIATGASGDSNLQPFTAVNFIISYEGIYPPRS